MKNVQKSMKYSLIFGLSGAVLVSVLYEVYANVSRTLAMLVLTGLVIFAGVKFSFLAFCEAFLGITCTLAYCGVLGFICYLGIHPATQSLLMKNSTYFQLELSEQMVFVLYTFLISLCMYVVWLLKFGIVKAIDKIKTNNKKSKEYIDNAFDDDKQ